MNQKVHVVGQIRHETEKGQVWDLQGVFENRNEALAICVKPEYFVVEIEVNKALPDEVVHFPTFWPFQNQWTNAEKP
jgi:hypothetical protein